MSQSPEYFKKEFKKRIYDLVINVLTKLDENKQNSPTFYRVSDQLTRSITSVIANYVEGQSGSSKKDFENYMNNSLKSANESKLWVSILKDMKKINAKDCDVVLKELDEISKVLATILIKSRKR